MDAEEILQDLFPQIDLGVIQTCLSASNGNIENAISLIIELQRKDHFEYSSMLKPYHEYNSSCGYCKTDSESSTSIGLDAIKLSPKDYQSLIDRGCRRSGTWLYKPSNYKTCCPQYTIRLDVNKFQISKTQKRVLKTMENYLLFDKKPQIEIKEEDMQTNENTNKNKEQKNKNNDETMKELKTIIKEALIKAIETEEIGKKISDILINEEKNNRELIFIKINSTAQRKHGDYSTTVASKIHGICKREKIGEIPTPYDIATTITKHINNNTIEVVVADNGIINFKDKNKDIVHKEVNKVNNKNKNKETKEKEERRTHKLTIQTIPSKYSVEEFELYSKYQRIVHKEEIEKITEKGYKRFLVESPLKDNERKRKGLSDIEMEVNNENNKGENNEEKEIIEYGSYHQQYRIDSKLIAVGVIDILPSCVSSVYFYYDPDYSFLSLGIYSALKEIEWIKNISLKLPNLHYYYMGFYIHSCVKMRYKGQYHPSDLLDPESYEWVPLSNSIPKLEKSKYTRFTDTTIAEQPVEEIIERVPLYVSGRIIQYSQLTTKGKTIVKPRLVDYVRALGPELATRIPAQFS